MADEAITGRRVVKIYGGEAYEASRFREVNEFIRRQALKLVASSSGAQGVVQLIAAVAVAAIVYLAISSGDMRLESPGTFAAFIGAMLGIRDPLNAVTGITDRLTRGLVAARDLFLFLEQAPSLTNGAAGIIADYRSKDGPTFEIGLGYTHYGFAGAMQVMRWEAA